MHIENYILPAHWASALINADYSGLTNEEESELNAWVDKMLTQNRTMHCIDCGEESWFSHTNDANDIAGNVMEFTFDVGERT